MTKCRSCGAEVDGDVCDAWCELRLIEAQEADAEQAETQVIERV